MSLFKSWLHLFVVPDTVLTTEAFLLPVNKQEVICCGPAGKVVPTLLTTVHDQPISHTVTVKTGVAADFMGDVLEADFVANLKKHTRQMDFQNIYTS